MEVKRKCIVHYSSINTSDYVVKGSEESYKTLIECQKIREKLGGENQHKEQCKSLGHDFEHSEIFYHRECFQKFTYAKTLLKRKATKDEESGTSKSGKVQKLTRSSSSTAKTGERGLFPNICMVCKKKNIKVKGIRQSLSKIVTKTAERALRGRQG